VTRRVCRAAAGVLLAALAVALAACRPAGDAPGSRITFSISLAEDEKDAVLAILRRFERDAGIKVTLTAVTGEALPEKLKVDAGARRPTIHLFAKDNLALRVLVDAGLVQELSDVPIPEGVLPGMVPEPVDGRRYFLPFRPNVQVTYVNRGRFDRAGVAPPRTADELRAVAETLKKAAGTAKVTLSLAEGGAAAVTVTEWILMFGGDPLVLNDDGAVRALEFLQGLWRDGLLAQESLLAKYDTQVDYLQGETAWLAPNWPFTSKVLAEQDLLERFHVYAGWRGPARAARVVGGDVLGVPRGVTGPWRDAALALARFLMSREAQRILVAQNAWPSIRGDVYADVPAVLRETFGAIQAALRDGVVRPNVAHWPEVTEAMNEAVRRVVVRGEPARAVLDTLHAKVAAAARRKGVKPSVSGPSRPRGLPLS
jgi:trehalose transport system substrate-binding protein